MARGGRGGGNERENSLFSFSFIILLCSSFGGNTSCSERQQVFFLRVIRGMRNKAKREVVNKVGRCWFKKGNLFQIEFVE